MIERGKLETEQGHPLAVALVVQPEVILSLYLLQASQALALSDPPTARRRKLDGGLLLWLWLIRDLDYLWSLTAPLIALTLHIVPSPRANSVHRPPPTSRQGKLALAGHPA